MLAFASPVVTGFAKTEFPGSFISVSSPTAFTLVFHMFLKVKSLPYERAKRLVDLHKLDDIKKSREAVWWSR